MYEIVDKGCRNGIQVELRNVSKRARPRPIRWRTEIIGGQDGLQLKTLSGQLKPVDDYTDTYKYECYQHDAFTFACTFIESCHINSQFSLVLSECSTRALATQP